MTVEDLERVKRSVIRRYPISAGLALQGVNIELSKTIDTAAVVGKKNDQGVIEVDKLLVNPDFMDRLSFSERVFVLAHEALHIALKHFARSKEKPEADAEREYEKYCEREQDEAKRQAKKAYLHSHYQRLWNIATDACINAFLKRDGFTFPENVPNPKTGKPMQFIDMKDGLVRSAEKIYDALVKKEQKEKEEKEKEKQKQKDLDKNQEQDNNQQPGDPEQNNQEQQNNNENQQQNHESDEDDASLGELPDPDDYDGFDSHEHWTNDDAKSDSKDSGETKKQDASQEKSQSKAKPEPVDEEDILEKELEKREKKDTSEEEKKNPFSSLRSKLGIPDVKGFKPVLSWKRVLAGTQERIVEKWSTRRSSRFNPNPRIEEMTEETGVSVEVILDVSGSISVELLRGFLLQLYPIFETLYGTGNVSLKVGTFSTKFSGFQVIKNREDIASYDPEIGGWTNYEVAATSFSQNRGDRAVKIVFTDGVLDGKPEHKQRTRVSDIIGSVFGDRMNFTPLGGRIIRVSEKEYNDMIASGLVYQSDDGYHTSRI